MQVIKTYEVNTDSHHIYITIDVPRCAAEIVEVCGRRGDCPGFINITAVKIINSDEVEQMDDDDIV